MSRPERLDLGKPRDISALLREALRLYVRHFPTFLAIAAVAVVPAELIVSGVGLSELSSGYRSSPRLAAELIPVVVQLLVTTPLVTAMTVYALLDMASGRTPRAGRAIQKGLEAFMPVFIPVLIAVAAEAATAVTIVIALILIVRWYFVPQVVVVDGARGTGALGRSWSLTRGFTWRVLVTVLVANLLFGLAGGLVGEPFGLGARAANSGALDLVGQIAGETLIASPLALVGALLFFDLRARGREVAI